VNKLSKSQRFGKFLRVLTIIVENWYMSIKHKIYFLWRPFLKDPEDEHILEIAFTANADYIITYNEKGFENIEYLESKQ
jgi:predicted nucleic acid-binding protein